MSSRFGKLPHFAGLCAASFALSACQPGEVLSSFTSSLSGDTPATSQEVPETVKLIERDVEAPDVYDRTDPGLWDGRPSLGGVWVAAPNVTDPERVIIRNTSNGNFVIGALFRRERDNPGPPLQLSSDAAAALGILAGAPTEISVIALRREEIPDPAAMPAVEEIEETSVTVADAAPAAGEASEIEPIEATPLADPIAAAAAALDRTEAAAAEAAPAQRPERNARATPEAASVSTPASVAGLSLSNLEKPFLQVGIFSIEQNARNTATALSGAGILPTVLEQESAGKAFWRVVVGPATTASERAEILRTIKSLGFSDAYAVTN